MATPAAPMQHAPTSAIAAIRMATRFDGRPSQLPDAAGWAIPGDPAAAGGSAPAGCWSAGGWSAVGWSAVAAAGAAAGAGVVACGDGSGTCAVRSGS
jgi:hypothetical protein